MILPFYGSSFTIRPALVLGFNTIHILAQVSGKMLVRPKVRAPTEGCDRELLLKMKQRTNERKRFFVTDVPR